MVNSQSHYDRTKENGEDVQGSYQDSKSLPLSRCSVEVLVCQIVLHYDPSDNSKCEGKSITTLMRQLLGVRMNWRIQELAFRRIAIAGFTRLVYKQFLALAR